MENPIAVVILAAWCSALAAVVCGGGIFAATSEAWHTSSGDCDHTSGTDQVHLTPLHKSNRRLRPTLNRRKTFLNNMITSPHSDVIPNQRRFIIIEARVKQKKITCCIDGGAERSIISRSFH